jgi:hypothetical protein
MNGRLRQVDEKFASRSFRRIRFDRAVDRLPVATAVAQEVIDCFNLDLE